MQEEKQNRRVTKIRFNHEKKWIQIVYKAGRLFEDEYSVKCTDIPDPDFVKQMHSLGVHVVEMCELPEDYLPRIYVDQLNIVYDLETDIMSASIHAEMELFKSTEPLKLVTPLKPSDMVTEDGEKPSPNLLLTEKCVKDIFAAVTEAEEYLDGKRAQKNLFEVA